MSWEDWSHPREHIKKKLRKEALQGAAEKPKKRRKAADDDVPECQTCDGSGVVKIDFCNEECPHCSGAGRTIAW